MPTSPYTRPLAKMLPALGCQGAAGQGWGGVSPVLQAVSGPVVSGICSTRCSAWVGVGRMHPIRFASSLSVGFFQGKQSQ